MIGTPRKLDWQAAGLPQKFWNHDEPYEHFPFDTGRLRHVIELATYKPGWGKSLPPGEALGIARPPSFVSYVAAVVHVTGSERGPVPAPETHVPSACGFCANPEAVRSQIPERTAKGRCGQAGG